MEELNFAVVTRKELIDLIKKGVINKEDLCDDEVKSLNDFNSNTELTISNDKHETFYSVVSDMPSYKSLYHCIISIIEYVNADYDFLEIEDPDKLKVTITSNKNYDKENFKELLSMLTEDNNRNIYFEIE